MIMHFEGTPGSGKTYEAVEKIVQNLKKKRRVYTNIDGLDLGPCREMIKNLTGLGDHELPDFLHHLENEKVQAFWEYVEPGSLIVIDEAQNHFNSRDWQSEANRRFGAWASTHRHYGFDLVLITQRIERIDSAVRTLAEWTYRYRKMNFFGSAIQNKYIRYAYAGDDTGGESLSKKIMTYKKEIFACYKSYQGKDIKELGIMNHMNILKHPAILSLPVLLAVFFYFLSGSSIATGDIFGTAAVQAEFDKNVKESLKSKTPVSESLGSDLPGVVPDFVSQLDAPSVAAAPAPARPLAWVNGRPIYKSNRGEITDDPSI